MEVHLLPVLKDNYIFLLHNPETHTAIVVDPAIAAPVITKITELGATLIAILNTHHHSDHIGGNTELLNVFPDLKIYGGKLDRGRIPHQQVFLKDGDRLDFDGQFGHNSAQVLFIPGHTHAHIAYYFAESNNLFCGDTLFGCGCGRLFEGTPAQMLSSLQKLAHLPDQTLVWCAHEYTIDNLKFALTIDIENLALQARMRSATQTRANHQPTIPTNIGLEKQTNPFLRCDRPEIQTKIGFTEPVRVFTKLRGMKDLYRA
ncbi:hydroxyacylglutathione hydrolase [Synechococcus sp. PCC 7502]|uniref:hydroxyacylglutathione hydrolase n=1 Tax=Synechococcus sp. PCC 7502 TaxID=1173263 RepID=UPI00029FD08A|nr:hydroxyacylglutathione hydrolase [Synechococcus sp. PCC 7502]AFY73445.1 hydroxyacylglutathione hydrolase [Synechococcus sp. PCC 7502]